MDTLPKNSYRTGSAKIAGVEGGTGGGAVPNPISPVGEKFILAAPPLIMEKFMRAECFTKYFFSNLNNFS
jgi:hypothetical protein